MWNGNHLSMYVEYFIKPRLGKENLGMRLRPPGHQQNIFRVGTVGRQISDDNPSQGLGMSAHKSNAIFLGWCEYIDC